MSVNNNNKASGLVKVKQQVMTLVTYMKVGTNKSARPKTCAVALCSSSSKRPVKQAYKVAEECTRPPRRKLGKGTRET